MYNLLRKRIIMDTLFFKTITSLHDPLLPAWLDLYEIAFPPEERMLVSHVIQTITAKEEGRQVLEEIVAVVDAGQNVLGMLYYELRSDLRAAGLYYLAVAPDVRNQGLGSRIYGEMIARCRAAGCRILVFDVEIPELSSTSEGQTLALRRINFYYRHGTQLLEGVRSMLQAHTSRAIIPLYIMAYPLETITPEEVCSMAKELLSDSVTYTGPLRLGQPVVSLGGSHSQVRISDLKPGR